MVDNDRGQLILVGALLIAATIIGSVTLLNSIHSSPQINTQQDRLAVSETEQSIEETKLKLNRIFLASGSDTRLPYIDTGKLSFSDFQDDIGIYTERYNDWSANASTGILSLQVDNPNQKAAIVRQRRKNDGTYAEIPSTTVIEKSDVVSPRISVLVDSTDGSNNNLEIIITGEDSSGSKVDYKIKIRDTQISKGVAPGFSTVCPSSISTKVPVRIDITGGKGTITALGSGQKQVCSSINLNNKFDQGPYKIEFDNNNKAKGTFVITGAGPNIDSDISGSPGDQNWSLKGNQYVVNPEITVTYQTPNGYSKQTFNLYG